MNFEINRIGRKTNRVESTARLLKSPAVMASGVFTLLLPENPYEFYVRLKLLLE